MTVKSEWVQVQGDRIYERERWPSLVVRGGV